MRPIVTMAGIDEALSNLHYVNEKSLKYRLIRAIREAYRDENSIESLRNIETDELVKDLWETGDNSSIVKNRRKNFNSIKSSINADLKRIYENGMNSEGIIIGAANVFDMSDEAKREILETFAYNGTGESPVPIGKLTDILKIVNDILSKDQSDTEWDDSDKLQKFDQLKEIVRSISEKIGVSGKDRIKTDNNMAGPSLEGEGIGSGIEDQELEAYRDTEQDPDFEEIEIEEEPEEELLEEVETDEDIEEVEVEGDLEEIEIEEEPEEELLEEVEPEEEIEEVDDEGDLEEVETEEEPEEELLEEVEPEEDIEEVDDEGDLEEIEIEEEPEEELLEEVEPDEDIEEVEDEGDLEEVETEEEPEEELLEEVEPEEDIEEVEDDRDLEEVEIEEEPEEDLLEEIEPDEDFLRIDFSEEKDRTEGIEENEKDKEQDDKSGIFEIPQFNDFTLEDLMKEYGDAGYKGKDGRNKARLLADEFHYALSVMDRYYNQYILIPKGKYIIGSKYSKSKENGLKKVKLKSFYFGKFPVTNALFEVFIEKTGYVTTAEEVGYGTVYYGRYQKSKDSKTGLITFNWNSALTSKIVEGANWYQPFGPGSTLHNKRNHPVVQVSLKDAAAFAAWTGKRLPTEGEWEAASRTADGHEFPWGSRSVKESCNIEETSIGDTTPVDKYTDNANSYGVVDTMGNVMEWTLDRTEEPIVTGKKSYILKGGSWISGSSLRLYSRFYSEPETTSNMLGFRCIAY